MTHLIFRIVFINNRRAQYDFKMPLFVKSNKKYGRYTFFNVAVGCKLICEADTTVIKRAVNINSIYSSLRLGYYAVQCTMHYGYGHCTKHFESKIAEICSNISVWRIKNIRN